MQVSFINLFNTGVYEYQFWELSVMKCSEEEDFLINMLNVEEELLMTKIFSTGNHI